MDSVNFTEDIEIKHDCLFMEMLNYQIDDNLK